MSRSLCNPQRSHFLAVLLVSWLLAAAVWADTVRVMSWNLEFFPNGSPKEATAEVQMANVRAAADTIEALKPDVLLLQEVRDREACEILAKELAPLDYKVIVCSNFGNRQECAILARYYAEAAWSERWKRKSGRKITRGYTFASLRIKGRTVEFYSLHLKSNRGGTPESNMAQREAAIEQLLEHASEMEKIFQGPFVVGGDFNTNRDQPLFAGERTLGLLEQAGFVDPSAALPASERNTHPGRGKSTTFDYLLSRGFKRPGKLQVPQAEVSDHRPVLIELELP